MTLMICICERCKHEWATHKEKWRKMKGGELDRDINQGYPWQCPTCKSAQWRVPKQ